MMCSSRYKQAARTTKTDNVYFCMSYALFLWFASSIEIGSENRENLTINVPQSEREPTISLQLSSLGNVSGGRELAFSLTCRPFSSSKEAEAFGRTINQTLPFVSLQFEQAGIKAREDSARVVVEGEMIAQGFGVTTRRLRSEDFLNILRAELVQQREPLAPKLELALELYNSTWFEESMSARFLTLITVVECLKDKNKRSTQIQALVKDFSAQIREAKKGLSTPPGAEALVRELDSFGSSIGNLKYESIKQACKRLLEVRLGSDEASFFMDCYNERSQAVHDGQAIDTSKLPRLASVVSSLLKTYTQAPV